MRFIIILLLIALILLLFMNQYSFAEFIILLFA